MKLKYRDKIKQIMAAALLAAMLTGCTKGFPSVSLVSQSQEYSLPESMLIVATERNRYQQIYTDQIWEVKLPDGETFESYLLGQVKEFLQEMKTMNLFAKEKEVVVTSGERETLRKLSEVYYTSLSPDDIAYMKITLEDVENMYEEYYLSNKVVSELTKDMNLEISDSEAKVITVDTIVMSDAVTAAEVLTKVGTEGADFATIAKEYSEDTAIEKQMGRGENRGTLEDAAFALATGETSSVIEYGGKYHILRCVSDYDENATQARKDSLYQERKKDAFEEIYSQFKADNPMTFNDDIWGKISFSKDDKTTTTNFFELYKQYFPN